MRIEGGFCDLENLHLGFYFANCNDEFGDFKMLSIGFLIFEVNICYYGNDPRPTN